MKQKLISNEKIIVPFKGTLPVHATSGAGCFDIMSAVRHEIKPGELFVLRANLQVEIPDGYSMEIISRSGLAAKGIFVLNAPGIIDSDFRGFVQVILYSVADEPYGIFVGDRVAQGRLVHNTPVEFIQVAELSKTTRGENGLGSTGV